MLGGYVCEANRWALLFDVSGDDAEADLGHFLELSIPGAARGAVPGFQLIQQVHHTFKDLQKNNNDSKQKQQQKKAKPVPTPTASMTTRAIQCFKSTVTCI